MAKIEFTLLVPVFNTKPHALIECFESIESQTIGHNFPIIIIDDCSTDVATLKVLDQLSRRNPAQITVHRSQVNGGTSDALNKGHLLVQTEYVALSGSDDLSHPQRFEKQIRYLETAPHVDVLGTQLFSFKDSDPKRKPIFTSSHPRVWGRFPENGWATNHGTVFYKNQAVKDAGGYNLAYRRAQDIELWRQMEKAGKVIENLPEVLYAWRRYQ